MLVYTYVSVELFLGGLYGKGVNRAFVSVTNINMIVS
jgi:hypothetical protein